MIDHNGIISPYSISAFGKDVSEPSPVGDVGKRSEDGPAAIKIIRHIDDFEALEQKWKELAEETATHVFQTFEWNRIWWKHFGSNKKLHILAVYSGNKLAGIAPLFEDDISLFGRKVYSCLRFLGSYVSQPEGKPLTGCISYSDYLDFIIRPGQEQNFYALILQHFHEFKSTFSEIILNEVPEESTLWNEWDPAMVKRRYGLRYTSKKASISPVIQLESTWEEYLDSMKSKDRYNARRYYNRSKQGDNEAFKVKKIKHAGELPCVLSDLIRMHQKQWNNQGFPGTFSEKRMREFFIETVKTFYEKGWIQFNMAVPVEKDKINVAIDALITYKNRVCLMHRGMDDDPLYKKLGPGNVLLYKGLHEAIDDGVSVFDMLRGSEDFKLRVATKINQNWKITVCTGHNKAGKLWNGLVKIHLKILRRVRSEKLHIKFVFKDMPFFQGMTDYIQFLLRRIKHKS